MESHCLANNDFKAMLAKTKIRPVTFSPRGTAGLISENAQPLPFRRAGNSNE